jgi:Ca2+-binding RTX toxin-like protein
MGHLRVEITLWNSTRAVLTRLTGSADDDTFVFGANFGQDIVTDFVAESGSNDVLEFHDGLFADAAAVLAAATASGSNTIITIDATTTITLQHVNRASLTIDDFHIV